MDASQLAQILNDIETCPQSAQSKRSLVSKMNVLNRTPGFPQRILEVAVPAASKNGKLATEVCILRSILSICTFSPTLRSLVGHTQRRRLALEAERLGADLDAKRAAEGKRDNDVPWETVLSWDGLFPRGTLARLIYLLYTRFAEGGGVQRADWTPMKLVDSMAECDKDETVNYLVREPPTAVFNVYKTARRYGQKVCHMCPEIFDEIGPPRTWLFETVNGQPLSANGLVHQVARSFERHTGRHVTINTLRRSYADYTMRNATTAEEARHAAHAMDHSLPVHEFYAGGASVNFLGRSVK
jgi:hypothetical protein